MRFAGPLGWVLPTVTAVVLGAPGGAGLPSTPGDRSRDRRPSSDLLRTGALAVDALPVPGVVATAGHERPRRGSVAIVRGPRLGEPRYELRLVRGDGPGTPVLVWSRHRVRWLAERSLRMEQAHLRIAPARLVMVDRRAGRAAGEE